jgi:outer membrane immunogenic protein
MRKLLAAASIAASFGFTAGANAADLYAGGLKDAYVVAPSWGGFYFGANGGYGWDASGSKNLDVNVANIATFTAGQTATVDGGFGGAQIGYNWQQGHLVFGLETDIQVSDIQASKTTVTPLGGPFNFNATDKAEIDWFGTFRGRIGYLYDNTLLYFTGGLAYGKVVESAVGNLGIAGFGNIQLGQVGKSDLQTGYVLGGGVEFKPGAILGPNWTVKLEYQYINLGSENMTGTAILGLVPLSTNSHDNEFQTIRFGVNYHLPAGYAPLK